jgi:hypothetical protein
MKCRLSDGRFYYGAALLLITASGLQADEPRFAERWVYASHNLLVNQNVEKLLALIERAGQSGYNGLVLADYKFNILDRMPPEYFRNVARVRAAAAKTNIEIIPTVFPIGYSAGILAQDPNLAEGIPVENAPFVVMNGEAVLVPDPVVKLVNGDLEDVKGNRFAGYSLQDDPGVTTFADRQVIHHGKVSCRMQEIGKHNKLGNCRLAQRVKVRPHACYRLSCWVKTEDWQPRRAFQLLVRGTSGGGQNLTFQQGEVKSTQDWTRLEVVFNSLGENAVQVYAGQWGGKSGTLWIDELALEELALVGLPPGGRQSGWPSSIYRGEGLPEGDRRSPRPRPLCR